jgi:leucyl aminopeptidase
MQFSLFPSPLHTWSGDCALIFCVTPDEGTSPLSPTWMTLDQSQWGGMVQALIEEYSFQGKANSTIATRLPSSQTLRKIVLVGLGDPSNLSLEVLRRGVATGLRQANQLKAKQVAIQVSSGELGAQVQALAEASLLVAHQDTRFKSQVKPENGNGSFGIEEVIFCLREGDQESDYTTALAQAQEIASGTILARELISAPANIVTPLTLAETARTLATTYNLEVEILGQAECESLGMGAFLGVAQASDLPPQFIHLTYRPVGDPVAKLALVGKGLTFDSGGLNIKTDSRSIAMMKTDMGGSAAVLGAARVIGALKPQVEVHFIVAATENMISGRALHPGDILRASNQKTIEINNTDAEGRLTLADALVFAEKLGVDAILDLATLTGACIVALGEDIAGLFTSSDQLSLELEQASQVTGEKLWRLPMEESYFEGLSSSIADMKNTGPRSGGSITAALFLKQFVEKTPWAHLDVAGPVWSEKEQGYINKGGTGFGVRLLVHWILSRQK